MCKACKTWCSCTVHVSIHITNKVIPNKKNFKSPLSLLQNIHQMTFMTYTASTEIIYAHTIISRRFTEMKQNTDYVHKILSWLIYQCYSNDRKWRIAACRHRMLCLLESSTNSSINTFFKNYPSILYMSNLFLTSVTS